jgi:hypothetical protein
MYKAVQKYRRRVSVLILLSYIFLLGISTSDIHKVDIQSGNSVLENVNENGSGGYSYSDENSCPVHFAYSSVHQVIFHTSEIISVLTEKFQTIQLINESEYNSIHLTCTDFRAPPIKS